MLCGSSSKTVEENLINQTPVTDHEINLRETKLQELQKECQCTNVKLYNMRQFKEKTVFELNDIKMRNKALEEKLKFIQEDYLTCVKKTETFLNKDKTNYERIKALIMERDTLKEQLRQLKRFTEENSKELAEINLMITIQQKKNTALLRKLRRISESKDIPEEMQERVNVILGTLELEEKDVINNQQD